MSNLKELKNTVENPLLLLKEIKNSGVEFKKLENLFNIRNGYTPSKKNESYWSGNTIIPWFRLEDIRENGRVLKDSIQYVTPEGVRGEPFKKDSLIISTTATIGEYALIESDFLANQQFTILTLKEEYKEKLLPKFLLHYACILAQYCKNNVNGITFKMVDMSKFRNFEIPIPPLEVQAEIVRILDIFTKDVNELIDLLKREQELRKKQHSYYLDKFTTIENSDIVKLKDVAIYRKERLKREFLTEDNYISVENLLKDRAGKIKSSNLPSVDSVIKYEKEDILIGNIRPYLKKIWFSDCIGGTNGDVLAIGVTNKEKVYPKYLYYILSSDTFFSYDVKHSQCGKMPRGRKDMILEFTFKLPPIDTQKRIVDLLDNFERYTNDLQKGLPAEIEKRKKQYAYYRDELLKFERK